MTRSANTDVYRVMSRWKGEEEWQQHTSNLNGHGFYPALKNARQAVASTKAIRVRYRLPVAEFKIQKLGVAHTSFAVYDQALEWVDISE